MNIADNQFTTLKELNAQTFSLDFYITAYVLNESQLKASWLSLIT